MVLLEEHDDIGCKVYMCVKQREPDIYYRYYLVDYKRPGNCGCKQFGFMEQVTAFLNKLRGYDGPIVKNPQKDSGDKIVKMAILGTKWGEWNV